MPEALTNGFRLGYLIAAGLAAAAAAVTFALVPRQAASGQGIWRRAPVAAGVALVIGGFILVDFAFGGSHGAPIGQYTKRDTYSFVSEPGLHPPVARADVVPHDLSALAPGYIFLANFYDLNYPPIAGQSGPLILDSSLAPVWFRPLPVSVVAGNLSLQRYQGKPALAWWQGDITNAGATTSGEDVIVDQHYQTVARLRGADGWIITLHELVIRGDHAWVTANRNIPMDLSKYGGAYNGALIDSAVQEYDLRTGRLLHTWDALDHIPLSDSRASLPTNGFPWDAYHVNSIDLTGGGKFLVSMRNTWAAYLVDIDTGRIEWTLGGRHSSFRLGTGADFEWQHDVALDPDSTITLFDDHCCQETGGGTYVSPTGPSRGLELKLDPVTHTARLAAQYGKGASFDAQYMGSNQPLPGGGAFVGWGSQPNFSEFSGTGKLLLDVLLPHPDLSYRATLEHWVGLPRYPPAGAARSHGGRTTIYASWNGATQVAGWKVLAGSSNTPLAPVTTVGRSGFETAIPVRSGYTTFEVQALDAGGRTLATSRPFTASG